jgi:PD-(D/E)XK endonuclease
VLTTDQKGALAEIKVAGAALELGIGVWTPFGDERYDLIFDLRPELVRVQCKWATLYGDVVVARLYRARRNAKGLLRRVYSAKEIDAFAIYCGSMDRCFFIPIEEAPRGGTVQLRVKPTRNNQKLRIRWAEDVSFAAKLCARRGAVAQLGERGAGSAQVTGSSPVGSTSEAASSRRLPLF